MSRSSRGTVDGLMGWTSSGDMKQQVHLQFDTKQEAIADRQRHGIPYQVFETKLLDPPAYFVFG